MFVCTYVHMYMFECVCVCVFECVYICVCVCVKIMIIKDIHHVPHPSRSRTLLGAYNSKSL